MPLWPMQRKRLQQAQSESPVCRFEQLIGELQLSRAEWAQHPGVKAWVKKHAHRHYVPEELLSELGITPDTTVRWD